MSFDMLSERFKKILTYEERAKYFYDHYIDQLEEGEIKKELISIRDDEIKHIRIAKKLIELAA